MQNLQKNFWLVPILTMALVVIFIARGVGMLQSRDTTSDSIAPKPPPESSADVEKTPTIEPISADQIATVLDRNIFDSVAGSLLHVPTSADDPGPEATGELNIAQLVPCQGSDDTKLEATIADDRNPGGSFATVNQGGARSQLFIGDAVGGRKIVAITWRYVILEGAADVCYLDIF